MRTIVLLMVFVIGCASASRRVEPTEPSAEALPEADEELMTACGRIDPYELPECDAADRSPPSRTMEAAKRAYDRRDYLVALPQFTKVFEGRTGDSGCNRQRALFFRGKTLFHLQHYRQAFLDFAVFTRAGSSNRYYWQVARWMVALERYLPEAAIGRCIHHHRLFCEEISPDP
jgi:hypothetical protein